MTEHTQGPWSLHKYPGHVEALNGLNCCDHDAIIADTLGHGCNTPDLLAEQQANARLIAAAPDLLAALENLTNSLGDDHQWCWTCEDLDADWEQRDDMPHHPDCIIGKAKAAIDKANSTAFDCVDGEHGCYNADQPCGCPCDNCHDDTEFRCKVCNTLIDTQMSAMLTSRSLEICEDCQGGE